MSYWSLSQGTASNLCLPSHLVPFFLVLLETAGSFWLKFAERVKNLITEAQQVDGQAQLGEPGFLCKSERCLDIAVRNKKYHLITPWPRKLCPSPDPNHIPSLDQGVSKLILKVLLLTVVNR